MQYSYRRIIIALVLLITPLLYTFMLERAGVVDILEARMTDVRYRFFNPQNKFSDRIVVLDIDEYTLTVFGQREQKKQAVQDITQTQVLQRWPWPRNVYYPIFEHLAAMGVRGVLMDIMFISESRDEYNARGEIFNRDDDLAQANLDFPIVSHALKTRMAAAEDAEFLESHLDADYLNRVQGHGIPTSVDADIVEKIYDYNVLEAPTRVVAQTATGMHCVSVEQDAVGVLTSMPAVCKYKDTYYPSLAVQGARLALNVDSLNIHDGWLQMLIPEAKSRSFPIRGDQLPIHFYSQKDTLEIPRFPLSDIIDDARRISNPKPGEEIQDFNDLFVHPEKLQDKIVVFGASAKGAYDRLMTPYGELPGVLMQATMLSNLINGDYATRWPDWSGWLVASLMLIAIIAVAVFGRKIVPAILVPVILLSGYLIAAAISFQQNLILPVAEVLLTIPFTIMTSLSYQILVEGREKRKFSKILGNMVDPTIVSEALKDLDALKKGGEKEITAFFSDVAGFSTISEQLSANDLAALLNEYLSAMTLVLKEHRGTLDKYIGDAVVGIFNAPLDMEAHAIAAARASLQMINRLHELKTHWQAGQLYSDDARKMQIRIGLNTGMAKVGFMGTDELASYTMMGDTVNLAARLEAAAKDYGVDILISESTNAAIAHELQTRLLDMVVVKGKTEPVRIYELVGEKKQLDANIIKACDLYEQAFQAYLDRAWSRAIELLEASLQARAKEDKAVAMLKERCEIYSQTAPSDDWQGAYVRTHK